MSRTAPFVALTAGLLALLLATGPAAGAHDDSYRLQPGDTLSALALRFATTVRALVAANALDDPDLVVAGRRLVVPGPAAAPTTGPAATSATGSTPASAPPGRHLVAAGETLGGLAARYGVARADLARWNGLTGDVVYAGTSLAVHDPGPGPSGPITCPVDGARFVNDYGFPRAAGRHHVGIDLFASRGTPVRAPSAGTVGTAVGSVGGQQIWLTDGAGNRWLASHLDDFGATGTVAAGAVVGYVGDSGNALGTSPHVHLEYHPAGGDPVNPYPALRAAC